MWEYNRTPSPDELYHYGVVGMKWGKRRAAAKGQSYTYTSHSTNKYNKKTKVAKESAREWDEMARYAKQKGKTKKAAKYAANAAKDRADAQKYGNRAKRSAQHDKNMQKLADKTSAGSTAGAILLAGGQNTKGYMQRRAAGMTVGRSVGGTVAGNMLLGPGAGRIGGMVAKSKYIRQDELKKKKR
jgi:hypothetical protein